MIRRHRGFTLLEVMVALLVFSLLTGTAAKVASNYIGSFERVRDHALAGWLADNRITELRLQDALPPISENVEDRDYGPFRWRVRTVIAATSEPTMRRIEVIVAKYRDVGAEPFRVLSISAFLGDGA